MMDPHFQMTHDEAACGGSALTAELGDYNPLMPAFEAMRRDAERYRWLRGGQDVPSHSLRWPRWEVRNWDGRWWETLFAEKLDAAIDAAMQRDKVHNASGEQPAANELNKGNEC